MDCDFENRSKCMLPRRNLAEIHTGATTEERPHVSAARLPLSAPVLLVVQTWPASARTIAPTSSLEFATTAVQALSFRIVRSAPIAAIVDRAPGQVAGTPSERHLFLHPLASD